MSDEFATANDDLKSYLKKRVDEMQHEQLVQLFNFVNGPGGMTNVLTRCRMTMK